MNRSTAVVIPMEERVTLSVEEAARRLGIGRSLAYAMVMRGEIPSLKCGKLRRIPVVALDRWIEQQAMAAGR